MKISQIPPVTAAFGLLFVFACTAGNHGRTTPAQPGSAAAAAPTKAPATPTADADKGADDDAIIIGHKKTLRSEILGEERSYLVYLPPSYKTRGGNLPVLYLLDGPGHFHHTTGILSFLSQQGRMPEMIVVAVANTDRTRDLTPTRIEKHPTSGGADNFLGFIETELIPEVEKDYRTAPYRMLIGHSFGGLFAIHAFNEKPDLFNAYVSISPSLWWDDGLMQKNTAALLEKRPDLEKFLYITLGNERQDMIDSNRSYAAMLERKAPKGLQWSFTLMDKEDHGSIPHRTTYNALETLFSNWRPPKTIETVAALQAHYEGLSKTFGHEIPIPEQTLNLLGYKLLVAKKTDAAIAAFKKNIELYPDSANVYDSLGEAYEKSGQMKLAAENYAIAVEKAKPTKHPYLETYAKNLDRARAATAK